jgi:murein hydrolase activator
MKPILFFLTLLLLFAFTLPQGSGRAKLERNRAKLLRQMQSVRSNLAMTTQKKASVQENYTKIQTKLEAKKEALSEVGDVLADVDETIDRNTMVIDSLKQALSTFEAEYRRTIRHAFRMKVNHSFLHFLLSSEDFNMLSQRLRYIAHYDRYRKYQLHLIEATRHSLEDKNVALENKKEVKSLVFEKIETQTNQLSEELSEKETKLNSLKIQEKELASTLAIQQQKHEKFNVAIEEMIRNEIDLHRRAARRAEILEERRVAAARIEAERLANLNTKKTRSRRKKILENQTNNTEIVRATPRTIPETPESRTLSDDFRNNQNRLPWPVQKGSISRPFGTQMHPTLRNIEIQNNGIDLNTPEGAEVSAVFKGKVVGVQFIPGFNYMVMLQHGSYYTVYSNLTKISVRRGDSVQTSEKIGKIGAGDLHFEVWQQRNRLNPSKWLAR